MQSSYQASYKGGAQNPTAGTFAQQPTIDWGMGSSGSQPNVQFGGGSIFGNSSGGLVKDSGEFNASASSVREYAYEEDKNMRFRPQMEDTYCIVDKAGGDTSCGVFCIFDGHGGKQVSDHCAERFPTELRKEIQKGPADLHKPLTDIFAKVSPKDP